MQLPVVNLPQISVRYPTSASQNLNSVTSLTFDLKRTQGVLSYDFVFNEGTLSGGTTPTWAVSITAPIVTHVKIVADNDTIVDADYTLLAELQYLLTLVKPDGTFLQVEMCDRDYATSKRLGVTLFPSWIYNQVQVTLTFNAVASITSGSPTTTPITVDCTEEDVPRSAVNFKPLRKKLLQVSSAMAISGQNDLTSFLAQTGAYKAVLLLCTSSNSAPYSNGTDSIVTNLDLILNDVATVRSENWLPLKMANKAQFMTAPDTGYVALVFMNDDETSKLLDLRNTQKITSVDLRTYTSSGSDYLYALRIVYQ